MPNADELAHQHIQAARALAERTTETDAKVRKEKAAVDAARLRRLIDNEDFQWFLANCFEPIHQKNHDEALNVALSPEVRSNFAHRHDLSRMLKELPAKKEAELRTVAGLEAGKG